MTLTLLAALFSAAQPPDIRQLAVATVDVAPGIVVWTEPAINPIVSSNIVAVIGEQSVMVFDAGHHPAVTQRVIADLRTRTRKPVSDVVISHWHDDHWVAAPEFTRAWPGVRIIAHPFTAAMIGTRTAAVASAPCRADLQPPLENMRGRLRDGRQPNGTALSAATRERLTRFVGASEEALAQCEMRQPTHVTQVITDSLRIELGGRTVVIRHPGRANTAGDLVAYVTDAKVALTGDLLVSPFPFSTMPYITEWASALRDLETRAGWAFVPGHGPVQRDAAYLRTVAELLESIAGQARAAWRPGVSEDSLRARIDVSTHAERFARGDAFIRLNFEAQVRLAIARMWQELAGMWKPES